MKNSFLLIIIVLFSNIIQAQINVFECTSENSSILPLEFSSNLSLIQKPCIIFENSAPYSYQSPNQKTVKGVNNIEIKTDFYAKPLGNGFLHLKAGNKAEFNVMSMNYTNLTQVLKLKKFELGITLPNDIQEKVDQFMAGNTNPTLILNPYMDWDLRVYVEYSHPNISETIIIDGFYNQEYEAFSENPPPPYDGTYPEEFGPDYNNGFYKTIGHYNQLPTPYPFLIRFSPPELGKWEAKVKIVAPNLYYESESFNFTVVESGSQGYIKVGDESRFFKLGERGFYPLGANILWPITDLVKNNEGFKDTYLEEVLTNNGSFLSEDYRQVKPIPRIFDNQRNLIRNIANGGGNFVRLLMHPFSQEIEFEKLGDYTNRLYIAQELDKTLEYCENRGIYIDWNLQVHYLHRDNNPEGYAHQWTGGPFGEKYCYNNEIADVDVSEDFFTNETAKKYYKQRYRYILARWGYSTNIAMFELFSEIGNENTSEQRAEINQNWHAEMASYLKSHYNGQTHLLQPSYAGLKRFNDGTFKDENIDVMTTNVYPGLKTYAKNWIDQIQKEYLEQDNNTLGNYTFECPGDITTCTHFEKPFFLSEFNPTAETCDYNQIEVRRSNWQIPFSGVAGALSWYSYKNGIVFSEYAKIKQFLENMDGKSGWHPGAMQLASDGRWLFIQNWANDMDRVSKKADLMYLRSADKNFAIGVITNKTYNIYTGYSASCIATLPPEFDHLEETDFIDTRDEDLFLNGLKNGRYYITYFMPNNQSTPYISDDQNGPRIKIKTLIPANDEQYIVLFMARRTGSSWMPEQEDSIAQIMNAQLEVLAEKMQLIDDPIANSNFNNDAFTIYPNPVTEILIIKAKELGAESVFKLISLDGKVVYQMKLDQNEVQVDLSNLRSGVYQALIEEKNIQVFHQKVIKL